ncbi:DnaJ like subfamily A member 5 [Plasmodium inui San Antonio 1]|uniref:DnaJ like subfamily A member 5 n=1 Tax=Plasmodium inui San Antonio 1 TaxID=1237626 RepID=W7A8D1_9APIC|nr:DnaJ like subfamily A member 5 [Plasmodium inui San Antonio 1]EUD67513.1 DnaJ like subfamily A member 5 [Plasmodium inui San Antonio 1]
MDIEKCKCYYEILNVESTAPVEEIKKSYRKIILQYHPDKNSHLTEEEQKKCTSIFRQIQEAYECLVDERRRKWYDKNRVRIIAGKESAERREQNRQAGRRSGSAGSCGSSQSSGRGVATSGVNIWEYFSSSCYEGFNDKDERSFYNVYRKLFEQIIKEENDELSLRYRYGKKGEQQEGEAAEEAEKRKNKVYAPSFGNSQSEGKQIDEFYSYWSNFSTVKKFDYSYEYMKMYEQENRHVRRNLKKVAEKRSLKERKEFNENVRSLVEHVKKHDTRYLNRVVQLAEEKRKRAEEKEKQRREQMLQRKILFEQNEEKLEEQWDNAPSEEEEPCSYSSCSQQGDNERGGHEGKQRRAYGRGQGNHDLYCQDGADAGDDKNNDTPYGEIIYRCEVCRKNFKSMKQYNSHEKSKKHVSNFLKHSKRYATGSIFSAGGAKSEGKRLDDQMYGQIDNPSNPQSDNSHGCPDKCAQKSKMKKKKNKKSTPPVKNLPERINSASDSSHLEEDVLSWYKGKKRHRNKLVHAVGEEGVSDGRESLQREGAPPQDDPTQQEKTPLQVANATDSSEDYASSKRKKKLLKKKKKKEGIIINRKENEEKNLEERKEDNKDISGKANWKSKIKESTKNLVCKMCRETFDSRNKLFAHIQKEGHAANKVVADVPAKVNKNKKGNSRREKLQ